MATVIGVIIGLVILAFVVMIVVSGAAIGLLVILYIIGLPVALVMEVVKIIRQAS